MAELPPALRARLAKRGLIAGEKAEVTEDGCPQRHDPFHVCSDICRARYSSKSSRKARPSPDGLPKGWRYVIDKGSGDVYYWNTLNDEVQWTRPTKEADVNMRAPVPAPAAPVHAPSATMTMPPAGHPPMPPPGMMVPPPGMMVVPPPGMMMPPPGMAPPPHMGMRPGFPPAGFAPPPYAGPGQPYPPGMRPPGFPPRPRPPRPPHSNTGGPRPPPGGVGGGPRRRPPSPEADPDVAARLAALKSGGAAPPPAQRPPASMHQTCWKCGKKNPLPDGTCAKCAQSLNKKVIQGQPGVIYGQTGPQSRPAPYNRPPPRVQRAAQPPRGNASADGQFSDPLDPRGFGD